MALRTATSGANRGEESCDFEIISNDQQKPRASHLYLFEVVGAPMLKKLMVGITRDEAASALNAESAALQRVLEAENGLQTRCRAVWLHSAYMKDALEAKLDQKRVPRVVAAGCGTQQRV